MLFLLPLLFGLAFAGPCDPPEIPIECFAAQTVYTLDPSTGRCKHSSGCPGDGTFQSMSECQETCEATRCLRSLRTVNCFRAETIFVYDHAMRACVQTMGCPDQGTFETRELCDATCTKQRGPEKRPCAEICAATSCLLGAWCGEDENGKCGCHPSEPPNECASRPCGPCEKCVPVDRRCFREPCPQYDCIRSGPDNCMID